ncbi:TetR/AcrR family transcriptional regulator [Microbispora sp. H13382]|uniref:TetR/AcrR family transcriptional regulator n=1 Tax=Microbispora sp. H13382 TaxID=2729112 RepID=UPI001603493F|nr:TetR/AcrR family transcriptional regulator [Microbispora sp. H13382]
MPRHSRFTRDDVIAGALSIADEQGLGAVTMAAVAGRVGVTPMALYRHVDDKEHLLDLLVEAVLSELSDPGSRLSGWPLLEALAHGLRAAAERHPHVFPLLLQRPAITSGSLLLRARIRGALLDCGVPAEDLDRGERLVSTVALGFLASEAGGRFHDVPPDQRDIDFEILLELVRQGLPALNGPRHHYES